MMMQHALFLVSKGYDVAVLTSTGKNLKSDETYSGIKIFRRDLIDPSICREKERIKGGLLQIVRDFKPNLVQFHNGCYPSGSSCVECGVANIKNIFSFFKSMNVPVLDYAHNAQLKDPQKTKELRQLDWDGIIFVSKFVQSSWKKLGFGAKKWFQVYNGIYLDWFKGCQGHGATTREKVIFFPSRIFKVSTGEYSAQKNFRLVLAACAILRKKTNKFVLMVVADPKSKNERATFEGLKKEIDSYSLGGFMRFVPPVTPDKIAKYYKESDIVCIPSINEAFSLSYIEAMAAGKVAIGTATGGTVELISDGVNGILVDAQDPADLAQKLELLIKDNNFFKKIIDGGLKTAKLFSAETKAAEVENIYKKFLISSR